MLRLWCLGMGMWLECHHRPCHRSLANPGMCIPSRSAACPLPFTHAPQVLTDNPLADFVELPEEYGDLHYCNLLPGVLRGALEQVGGWEGGSKATWSGEVGMGCSICSSSAKGQHRGAACFSTAYSACVPVLAPLCCVDHQAERLQAA